jgi:uncharacterized membrane protein
MTTSRLQAFSDAVLAIIITIMVLELEVPREPTLQALADSAPGLLTYLLSFVYLGIYWNNHHHLFQLVGRVRGGLRWANLHLLFWLSLVPFTTAWMDEQFAPTPVMVYGVNLCWLRWPSSYSSTLSCVWRDRTVRCGRHSAATSRASARLSTCSAESAPCCGCGLASRRTSWLRRSG